MMTTAVVQIQQPFKSHLHRNNHLNIGNSEFIVSGTNCYVTDLEDYTILSDFDITEFIEDDSQPSSRCNVGVDASD